MLTSGRERFRVCESTLGLILDVFPWYLCPVYGPEQLTFLQVRPSFIIEGPQHGCPGPLADHIHIADSTPEALNI